MRSYLPLLVAVCIIGCETRRQARPDWSIVPGQRAGAVTTLSSERELIRTYGAAAVQAARVELGEGKRRRAPCCSPPIARVASRSRGSIR